MTREEALQAIKEKMDYYESDKRLRGALETLIPELTENEDERIRKELVNFIKRNSATPFALYDKFTPEQYITYLEKQKEQKPELPKPHKGDDTNPYDMSVSEAQEYAINRGFGIPFNDGEVYVDERHITQTIGNIIRWADEHPKEQKPADYNEYKMLIDGAREHGKIEGRKEVIDHPEEYGLTKQKPAEWSEDFEQNIRILLYDKLMWHSDDGSISTAVFIDDKTLKDIVTGIWFYVGKEAMKNPNMELPKQEWSEEDEKKLERVDDLLWMLDDYLGNDCSICEEKTARLRDEIHNELFPWLEFLRPQYHGDVTMTEAYKMGLEAGKASSWKPSEKQTNNVIVELTRIELGDIINGLYYLKEKYYEDCKEHNGTATVGLSDEFKFYFKRFNEVLDLYTRLHELEKEKYGTTTDGYYYE